MADSIEDLYVVLTGDAAPLLASFAKVTAAGEEMAAAVLASLAEVKAAMLESTAGAGLGAGGAAGASAMEAENTTLMASMREVGAASASMAAEVEASYGAMASRTATLSQGMVAAEREAVAANNAVGAAMAGTAAQTEAGAAKATAAAEGMTKAGGLMSQAMFGVKLGLAAAAVESVKMAGDFESATERLALSAGEDQRNIDMVRQGMLSMAGQVGYSADQLATAMYKVESGGKHGADGLKVLQAAAEGAKTENADLTTVADALTSAMTDYKIPADQAAATTSKLVAATAQGKMTFQELAGSLAAVLPVASANHVALNDILGDLASMTTHGMSAQQATQNLADAIRHMAAPTQVQAKELAALGMNATEVSKTLGEKGLSGTINEISERIRSQMGPDGMVVLNLTNALKGMAPPVQDLGKKVLDGSMSMKEFTKSAKDMGVINDKQVMSFSALAGTMHGIGTEAKDGAHVYQTYSDALRRAMGDATGMNVALMIGGENAGITANAIAKVSEATSEAGNHVHGWSEIQQTFNQKWSEFKDGLGAAAIQIGTALLPAVGGLLTVLGGLFKLLADHPVLLVGLATVIAVVLAPAIWAAVAATWAWTAALLANPLTWVALLVAALAMGAYELIAHWRGVADFFKGVWHAVTGFFSAAWDVIKGVLSGIAQAWDSFWGGFANPGSKITDTVKGIDRVFLEIGDSARRALSSVGRALSTVWDVITYPFRKAWDFVHALFTMTPAQLGEAVGRGVGAITRAGVNLAEGFWHGLVAGWRATINFFTVTVPNFFTQTVPHLASTAGHALLQAGTDLLHLLRDGCVSGYHAVTDFFTVTVPNFFTQTAPRLASQTGHALQQAGTDMLHSMRDGIVSGYHATIDFFTALPGNIIAFFSNAGTWLLDAGKNILVGMWNGFTGFIGTIYHGITDFIGGFLRGFMQGFGMASPSTVMMGIGGNIIQGLWNGVVERWNAFIGMVAGFPGQVINMFANSGSWLVSAGYNICVGIYNGIVSGWSMLTNMVSNLAHSLISTAKSALGISSPSRLFADEVGAWIAPGMAQGISAEADQAITAAKRLANQVVGAMTGLSGSADFSVSGGGGFGPVGGSALATGIAASVGSGQVTNINVNVGGHIWSTQDLVQELQKQLLRHNIRNTSNATSYSFA